MAEPKTKENDASVTDFINSIGDEEKRKDSFRLVEIFEKVTHDKAKMWGSSIIGFGKFHYKSERSAQEGDWPLTGFSPRKQALTLYIMSGFEENKKLLAKLGTYKTSSGSCLYVKRLSDIDLSVLKELIEAGLKQTKERYKL